MEMTCQNCNAKGHNKRGCPHPKTSVPQEPPQKKPRGRPRKERTIIESSTSSNPQQATTGHHNVTAQPTQLGRGGRMILGGVGGRGAITQGGRGASTGCGRAGGRGNGRGDGTSVGRGGGRGHGTSGGRGGGRAVGGKGRGRGRMPIGVGVLVGADGNLTIMNGRGRGRRVANTDSVTQSSQSSQVLNPTQ